MCLKDHEIANTYLIHGEKGSKIFQTSRLKFIKPKKDSSTKFLPYLCYYSLKRMIMIYCSQILYLLRMQNELYLRR